MEKDRLGIAFLVLSLVSVGFTTQSAFAGAAPGPIVSINDVSMFEGDGPGTTELVFTITVTNFDTDSVTVDYSTAGNTATEGTDYVGGGISFPINSDGDADGITSVLVAIEIFGDTDFEDDETFFVNLSNCNGCTIFDAQGIGTIVNDDVVLSPDDVFVVMGACCNDDPEEGSLASADLDTGILTQIGDAVVPQVEMDGLSGLAINSIGRFFVTAVEEDSSNPSRLLELDGNTGAIIDNIGLTMFDDGEFGFFDVRLRDLSFQPGTGVLFGVGEVDETNNGLFTVDTSSAEVDLIGTIDAQRVQGLAFAPDGTLYGTTRGEGCELIRINPEDPMDIEPVTFLNSCYDGLGIDSSGQIFGTTTGIDSLHLINPDDGSDVLVAGEGTRPSDVDFLRELPLLESGTAYVSGSTIGSENLEAGAIGTVDFESGEINQIGNQIVEDGGLSGLTFDSNGDLFGSSTFNGMSSSLYKIDPITGDGTLINDIAIFNEITYLLEIRDLATQPGTDVIFAVGRVFEGGFDIGCGDFNTLFTINKEFASAECIGPLAIEGVQEAQFSGLAFAPDGTLYATGSGCVDNGESCDSANLLASFNPDASSTGFFQEIQDFLDGLGIRQSDDAFFGTTGGIDSVHSIDLETGETPIVAGEGDSPSDITFSPFDAPTETIASGAGGEGYEGPTLGEFDDGRLILSNGFCFDKFCLDVLDYFNHLPIQQVDSGTTHTISLTAYCSAGSNRCNYASVGAAPPGTDINSVDWNVMLKRTGTSNDWQVTKVDPSGMLGDVTGTVQVVDASRIQYTFNIEFITPASIGTVDGNAEPPEDNMILVTEIRDSNGGSGRNIFNEGVFVNDIYAYPQVDASYLPSIKVAPLCLNEDPTDRNTCAFEQVRQWAIKQAEEKLKEIYEQNNYKAD